MVRYLTLVVLAMVAATFMVACSVAADEYRIIPVTAWNAGFLDQADVDKLLGVPGNANSKGDVRNANCNAIIAQVRRRADVCYPSALGEPYMSGLSPSNFNALQAMLNAAHDTTGGKKRIEVHCWIVVFRTANGPVYQQHNNPSDPENYWITCDDTGVEPDDKAFDPGHPKAAQYVVDVCMDLVNNFDIDGLHYDYIRFTGSTQGYNPTSIARYNARYGLTGLPASGSEQFKKWRRDQITAIVRKVYAKVQAVKPWVKVSASFIGGAPSPTSSTREAFLTSSAYAIYSDWDSWMQEGIVDFGAPMTYFDMIKRPIDYANWLNFQRDRKANRMVVPDAGTYLNYLDDAINMLTLTRDPSPAGNYSDGFGAYSYQSPYCTNKTTDTYGPWSTWSARLLQDVTPTWADIPQMPWKTAPTKGHIGGTVTSPPNGACADGAEVTLTGLETRTMTCDSSGFYAFIDLMPGLYNIDVTYAAYTGHKTVTVTAGAITDGDIALVSDSTPPVITNIQVSRVTDGSAVVTWTTDDPATSQVEYDLAPYYGLSTVDDPLLVTSHSVMLTGLNPGNSYHFRVKSANGVGMAAYSGDYPFTTQSVASAIIVDELDPGCAMTGAWITSSSPTGWKQSYMYKGGVTGDPTCTAVWTPVLQRTGPYDVSVYYRAGTNRTTDAQFTINYAAGSYMAHVDQTRNDLTWVSIGTGLQFNAGQTGKVTLTNTTNKATDPRNVIADAVKFDYKGDVTAPVINSVADDKYTLSTSSLQASWNGSDAQSGISSYRYAVGTAPGMADVKAWTDAGLATSAAISGMSLQVGNTYYVSVRAINGAGLTCAPLSSNGVIVAQSVASIQAARAVDNGKAVALPARVVSAAFPTAFYLEEDNRVSAIRVQIANSFYADDLITVMGTMGLTPDGERAILDPIFPDPTTTGASIQPMIVITKAAGGGTQGLNPGITGVKGLNNSGMLVRVAGRVSKLVSDGFYLDDGSRITDETGYAGVKVWTGADDSATENTYVIVTGVVSCRLVGGVVFAQILMRDID